MRARLASKRTGRVDVFPLTSECPFVQDPKVNALVSGPEGRESDGKRMERGPQGQGGRCSTRPTAGSAKVRVIGQRVVSVQPKAMSH